eukprot:GHVL01019334.1.p1 GENE.GHVL01019334.1~~GHVL01019334.1.p1  ORF type:complete len:356 (+),score=95.43 GHVL01019334.1:586-1653(+)
MSTRVDIDIPSSSLVVLYNTEITKTSGHKRIRIHDFSDISGTVKDILAACKYVTSSQSDEIQKQLICLSKAVSDHSVSDRVVSDRAVTSSLSSDVSTPISTPNNEELVSLLYEPIKVWNDKLPKCTINDINIYIESLYDDNIDEKLFGAKCILSMCSDPRFLEQMLEDYEDGTSCALAALSRVVREEYKKCFNLSIIIICLFFICSYFSEFIYILYQYQYNDIILKIIEYELKRSYIWYQELENKKKDIIQSDIQELDKIKNIQIEQRRFTTSFNRQNRLLIVCIISLRLMCDDLDIEAKLSSRNIATYLTKLLDRKQGDLIVCVLSFLNKLTVFAENTAQVKIIRLSIIMEYII